MSKSDELEFIGHIHDEVQFILKATDNIEFESFYNNEMLKRAVTRALEIIGEATKNLDLEFKHKYPYVP